MKKRRWCSLTESKEEFEIDLNEYLDIDFIREIKQWSKIYTVKTPITEEKPDLTNRKRAEKR